MPTDTKDLEASMDRKLDFSNLETPRQSGDWLKGQEPPTTWWFNRLQSFTGGRKPTPHHQDKPLSLAQAFLYQVATSFTSKTSNLMPPPRTVNEDQSHVSSNPASQFVDELSYMAGRLPLNSETFSSPNLTVLRKN